MEHKITDITIRFADYDDKKIIFDFIKKAYADIWEYKIPHRWEWQFENNPFKDKNDLPIAIAIDKKNNSIFGQACCLFENLWYKGHVLKIAWHVDMYIYKQYRGIGIGTELKKKLLRSFGTTASIYNTTGVKIINSKLGYIDLKPIDKYVKPIKYNQRESRRFLTRDMLSKITSTKLRGVLTNISKVLFNMLKLHHIHNYFLRRDNARCSYYNDSGFHYSAIDTFDQRIDNVSSELVKQYDVIVFRDHKHLNWKYVSQPHISYQRYLVEKEEEIIGYLIVRKCNPPESNIGIISDVLVPNDENIIGNVLSYAIRLLTEQGVDEIQAATNMDDYAMIFRRLGFMQYDKVIPQLFSEDINQNDVNNTKWYFTRSDVNWDQVPMARYAFSYY